jgi:hypothetical protein
VTQRPTRDEAIRAAGAVLAEVLDRFDSLSPRQAAQAARRKSAGPDVDATEDAIRRLRGLAPLNANDPVS